jgi:hypothetical protein
MNKYTIILTSCLLVATTLPQAVDQKKFTDALKKPNPPRYSLNWSNGGASIKNTINKAIGSGGIVSLPLDHPAFKYFPISGLFGDRPSIDIGIEAGGTLPGLDSSGKQHSHGGAKVFNELWVKGFVEMLGLTQAKGDAPTLKALFALEGILGQPGASLAVWFPNDFTAEKLIGTVDAFKTMISDGRAFLNSSTGQKLSQKAPWLSHAFNLLEGKAHSSIKPSFSVNNVGAVLSTFSYTDPDLKLKPKGSTLVSDTNALTLEAVVDPGLLFFVDLEANFQPFTWFAKHAPGCNQVRLQAELSLGSDDDDSSDGDSDEGAQTSGSIMPKADLALVWPAMFKMPFVTDPFKLPGAQEEFQFFKVFQTTGLKTSLNITPDRIDIGLQGGLEVQPEGNEKPLNYTLGGTVGVNFATVMASMEGMWNNPYGIGGVSIGNTGMTLGIEYEQIAATGTPSSVGLTGEITIGQSDTVKNKYRLALDYAESTPSIIAVLQADALSTHDAISMATYVVDKTIANLGNTTKYMNAKLYNKISTLAPAFKVATNVIGDIESYIPEAGWKDLEVYFAPLGGSIGGITFGAGITLQGYLDVGLPPLGIPTMEMGGEMSLNTDGLHIRGVLPEIKIGKYIKISSDSDPKNSIEFYSTRSTTSDTQSKKDRKKAYKNKLDSEGPFVDISVKLKEQHAKISGLLEFPGFNGKVDLIMSSNLAGDILALAGISGNQAPPMTAYLIATGKLFILAADMTAVFVDQPGGDKKMNIAFSINNNTSPALETAGAMGIADLIDKAQNYIETKAVQKVEEAEQAMQKVYDAANSAYNNVKNNTCMKECSKSIRYPTGVSCHHWHCHTNYGYKNVSYPCVDMHCIEDKAKKLATKTAAWTALQAAKAEVTAGRFIGNVASFASGAFKQNLQVHSIKGTTSADALAGSASASVDVNFSYQGKVHDLKLDLHLGDITTAASQFAQAVMHKIEG